MGEMSAHLPQLVIYVNSFHRFYKSMLGRKQHGGIALVQYVSSPLRSSMFVPCCWVLWPSLLTLTDNSRWHSCAFSI